MRTWPVALCISVLAGGAVIVESGCGRSATAPRKDAGTPPDVRLWSGGAVGTGGVHSTGGTTGTGGGFGSGGAAGTGGSSTAGTRSTGGARGTATGGTGQVATGGASGTGGAAGTADGGGAPDGTSGCIDVCALYGEACCVWTDPCIGPASACTFDVLAGSVGTTYEYVDLETKVAALPQDISVAFTDQDIAWAAADPWPAGRIELHLTADAASRYGAILDGAQDGRVFRVSCGGQSLFVGIFYLVYGAAALNTPVLHEARENGVLVLRLGAYQSAWAGLGLTRPESSAAKERIDRRELRAAFCRRGVMHVLDPDAKPENP